jgi:diguanylate cyclase (GGDEF)-like protein/PAS domain S-box-containing protein
MTRIANLFGGLSIRSKLMVIVLVTVGIALLIADGVLMAVEWRTLRGQLVTELKSQAKIVGANSVAALLFDDPKAAEDTLKALAAIKNVRFAMLHDQQGRPFAIYKRSDSAKPHADTLPEGFDYKFDANQVDLYMPVMMKDQRVGTVHISSSLATIYAQLIRSVLWSLLTIMVSFAVGLLIYTRLHRLVTTPIADLAATITAVRKERDYSLRARQWAADEVGHLVEGFNDMLGSIQERDTELERHRAHLEEEVAQRTAELAKTKNFLEGIIQTSTGLIYVVDQEGCCSFVNDYALELLGYTRSELLKRSFASLFTAETKGSVIEDLLAVQRGKTLLGRECKLVRKDGNTLWFEYSIAPLMEHGKVVGAVTTGSDVTERKHMEAEKEDLVQELNELATRDGLTGLFNHRMFYTLLDEELLRAGRFGRPLSLLMIDIDFFKRVNDTHGHQAGDAILKGLSVLLEQQARAIDRVCRYGGEEIAVILLETNADTVPRIAERLRVSVEREPFDIGSGNHLHITISIGVATFPMQADSPQALVSSADQALYLAKKAGRNQVRVAADMLAGIHQEK